MGVEFDGVKLIDIYLKNHPHRVKQKYGQQLLIAVDFNRPLNSCRKVSLNPKYTEPVINKDLEKEE